MSMGLTQFAGPALAGILIVTVGPGSALAIDAASFGVSAFYLARLRLPPHASLPPQSFARDLLDGWRDFVARSWVWLVVVSASLGNMMGGVWLVLAAVWVKGHGGAAAWTAILVVSAVGGLAAGATALRVRPRRQLLLASIAVVPNCLPLIVLALQLPWEVLVVTALVTGFGNMLFNTLWETTLQQHIPSASLSRVSAYDWFGSLLCQPIGLALAGVVAAGIGMSRTLWIAARSPSPPSSRSSRPPACGTSTPKTSPESDVWMVQEWADNEAASSTPGYTERITIPRTLADSIAALNGGAISPQAMVHGDINPGNIHISSEGDVKLVDFGQTVGLCAIAQRTKRRTLSAPRGSGQRARSAAW